MGWQLLYRAAVSCAIFFLLADLLHASSDTERRLHDELQGKTLVLRDFYTGDHLHYDSSAAPLGGPGSGDWMSDGFILVKDLHFSHHRLTIDAERKVVIQIEGKEFQLLPEEQSDGPKLKIDADLNLDTLTPQQLDAALGKIFLAAHDSLANLVSEYWKPCVLAAAVGQDPDFRFSRQLLSVPGVAVPQGASIREDTNNQQELNCSSVPRNERGVHPIAIYQPDPEFSERARREKHQGVVILSLEVNDEGLPSNLSVIRPLGYGLDEKAIACVKNWRFKAAERNGQAVAAKIAVEINFHLY
jgi:TonB family protein